MNASDLDTRTQAEWYADQTDSRLRCLAAGAWTANDRDGFCLAHAEMNRRAAGGADLKAFYVDSWQQVAPALAA